MEEQEAFLDVFGMAGLAMGGVVKNGRIGVLKYPRRRPGQRWATAQFSGVLLRSTERGDAWG